MTKASPLGYCAVPVAAGSHSYFGGLAKRLLTFVNLSVFARITFASTNFGSKALGNIAIHSLADSFRIEIGGRFEGTEVGQVANSWRDELLEVRPRTLIVDISHLSGYDRAGFLLLQEMHYHGTQISARTSESLSFLSQISGPRVPSPTLVYRAESETRLSAEKKDSGAAGLSKAKAAAGQ